MKSVPVALSFAIALPFAHVAMAEDISINWQQTGVQTGYCSEYGSASNACGYLPKASDGNSETTLIYQLKTGFAEFQYIVGGLYPGVLF